MLRWFGDRGCDGGWDNVGRREVRWNLGEGIWGREEGEDGGWRALDKVEQGVWVGRRRKRLGEEDGSHWRQGLEGIEG